MMRVELNCTGWADKAAAWEGLISALDPMEGHGRNPDALWDGLLGGLLTTERPLVVVIRGQAQPKVFAALLQMQDVFTDARETEGEDVRLDLGGITQAPARR